MFILNGAILEPENGRLIDSGDLLCSGWAGREEQIQTVRIYVDRKFVGNADAGNIMGGYENYFFFYKPDLLEDGPHTISVTIVKDDGTAVELGSHAVNVNKSRAAIQLINVQLTNRCNLRCRWCSVHRFSDYHDMELPVFKKMMSQIMMPLMDVREVMLQTAGESLLHPQLGSFLDFLGSLEKRPKTTLVTNATCLTDRISRIILSSKGLDSLQFSVDGGTKESYEWLRRGAVYEKTIDNIQNFLTLNNGSINTGIIAIDLGQKFDDKFRALCDSVDNVEIRPPHNWTGFEELENFSGRFHLNRFPCVFIKNNLMVRSNGDVSVCCADQIGRGIIGNIETDTLYHLWKTQRFEQFRSQAQGKKDSIPLCAKCSIFS